MIYEAALRDIRLLFSAELQLKTMSDRPTPSLDPRATGARSRALRGNLLQEELAPKIGVSQGQLSKIESGRMMPGLEAVVRLANQFDHCLDWIVTGRHKR